MAVDLDVGGAAPLSGTQLVANINEEIVDLDARINALDAVVILKGGWDASAGTFPGGGTAQAGASYHVTTAGTVDSVAFSLNDRVIAILDNASTSTYASNWLIADYSDTVSSVDGDTGTVVIATASSTAVGKVELATDTETATGTDTARAVTPANVKSAYTQKGEIEGINAQTGTTYTLVIGDKGKLVTMSNASANTLTVPPNSSVAFAVNSVLYIEMTGAGTTTIAEGAGVTINSKDSALDISGQYGQAALIKTATDVWSLVGALA